MITYSATLDVPAETATLLTDLLIAERLRRGTGVGARAASARDQAVLVLRWFREDADMTVLAADTKISIATGYRYLHEALDVIAAHAPALGAVLTHARAVGLPFLCLDGTLIPTDRIAARAERGHHLWYSGRHHAFGGSVQVLCDPGGFPLWVSDVRPGSTHDLTAARELVLPALYPHAARGLPVLADKGYTGAGVGVHVPIKHHPDGPLHTDNRCYNSLITGLRAPAERGNALLGRWRALDRGTVSPHRIGAIVAAALVLTSLDRGNR